MREPHQNLMHRLRSDLPRGALAGALGTAAMTTLMNPGVVGWLPPAWRPAEFVPKQIIEWLEGIAGAEGALTEQQERVAAAAAHIGYGATMGVLYALTLGRTRRMPVPPRGVLWGALVWAIGYEGWLPAAGVRPATTEHPPREWPVPIANHLLYGITTALVFERLRNTKRLDEAVSGEFVSPGRGVRRAATRGSTGV